MISSTLYRFRAFAHEHDDIPAFHAAYLVATFLAAAVLNLGFFLVLILGHMALDFFKYREVHGFGLVRTFRAVILESIVDIALLLLALSFEVYLSHTFLLAGLSGIVRSELTILEALGTLLPKVHILEHMAVIAIDVHSYLHTVHPGVATPLSRIQKFSIALTVICTGLLAASFFIYDGDLSRLLDVYRHELIPRL